MTVATNAVIRRICPTSIVFADTFRVNLSVALRVLKSLSG